ncbi:MAG: hypothetical protein J6Z40_13705 [Oscillospiraceae bacterium]|nr:hypothetical protein [Oscillospiraceae bacterium]
MIKFIWKEGVIMKKAVILSTPDIQLVRCFLGITSVQIEFSEQLAIPADADCVLIAQQQAAAALPALSELLRERNLPSAALTFDQSEENQELLLDLGFDNIFLLPMSGRLLEKRICAMIGKARAPELGFDLFAAMEQSGGRLGAYAVSSGVFPMILRYVERLQDRMDKPSQLVTFRFRTRLNIPPEPGTLEEAFPIVQTCLRRGDIVTISGQEILAVLIGADDAGCKGAADRIIRTYQAHCCDSIFDMLYDIREIKPNR